MSRKHFNKIYKFKKNIIKLEDNNNLFQDKDNINSQIKK